MNASHVLPRSQFAETTWTNVDETDQKEDEDRPSKEAVRCIGTAALAAITVDSVISFS